MTEMATNIEQAPPPPYSTGGSGYGEIDISQNGMDTGARVAADGRVNIKINQRNHKLSDLLAPALRAQLKLADEKPGPPPYIPPGIAGVHFAKPPPMNIVIQIVGSRGDVQPFIALGQVLKNEYGHRVRVATHPTFRQFVTENGLEFFSIGGDPAELMAFMVKNPGLMPGMDTLKSGDISKRRKGIYEMITGCWRSAIEPGDGTGIQISDDMLDGRSTFNENPSISGDPLTKPFVADAIIANPVSFAHIHIAEKLGIPLHLMFTMPWSPTQAFPHPLANILASNADQSMANFISYALVDMMTWQGLGDVINRFREKSLGLEPVSIMWAPGMTSRLRIPYTYCWSPALIPKPRDWGNYIDISGFYFLNLSTNYTPSEDLAAFLAAGPPPVYIGFGSIVVDDPNAMTKMIFDAVRKTGQRALVSKGWGGFGADEVGIPEGVFMLGNCPHDWLFKRVSCVVHHGGAGTTAAGIAAGRPTVVVPFFGDQPFWGAMTARAGAGPMPTPYKELTADKLAEEIMEALKPESLERAAELSAKIAKEKGAETGAQSFHNHLRVDELRCSLCPSHAAAWRVKRTDILLSPLAATVLGNEGLLDFNDLKLHRPREYETEDGPWEPISGGASALIGTLGNLSMGVADFPVEVLHSLKKSTTAIKEKHDAQKRNSPFSTPSDMQSPDGSIAPSASQSKVDLAGSKSATPSQSTTDLSQAKTDKTVTAETAEKTVPERPKFELHQSNASTISDTTIYDSAAPSAVVTTASTLSTQITAPDVLTSPPNGKKQPAMASVLSQDGTRKSSWSHKGSGKNSRDASPHGTKPHHERHNSDLGKEIGDLSLDSILAAGKGVQRIVGVGMKSPMDFTMGIAKGFHNAPKLYGDDTVRSSEKITGLQSGLKAAGKEFGFGFWDGITGLVTQPVAGAKKEGAAGFVKGVGKSWGGLVLKPAAGIWGLPGYTFKGIYAEVQKHFGTSVQNYIIAARTAQGYEEWKTSTPRQRQMIVENWKSAQLEQHKHGRKFGKEREEELAARKTHSRADSILDHDHDAGRAATRHMSWDERKQYQDEKERAKKDEKAKKKAAKEAEKAGKKVKKDKMTGKKACRYCSFDHDEHYHDRERQSTSSLSSANTTMPGGTASKPQISSLIDAHDHEYESAIKETIAQTSRGNPEEDAMIERAIRASVKELKNTQSPDNHNEAYERAIAASIAESKKNQSADGTHDPKHEAELEKALKESLAINQQHFEEGHKVNQTSPRSQRHAHGIYESSSELDTEDEDNYKKAMAESTKMGSTLSDTTTIDEQYHSALKEAIQQSEIDHADHSVKSAEVDKAHNEELKKAIAESEAHGNDLKKQKTEEEIVLEYVKKQSLLEEEHKKAMQEKTSGMA